MPAIKRRTPCRNSFGEAHRAAEEAWDEAHPRVARYFDEFGFHIGMKREDAVLSATLALARREFPRGRGIMLHPPEAARAHDEKVKAINEEAERLADEFMAYQERHIETKREHRVEELKDRAMAYMDSDYLPARDALMTVPAPDHAGLLVKIEIAARSLAEEHLEAALEDARRLLAIN